MAAWVNVDVIPQAGRPAEVEKAIEEAAQLRDRARQAQEQAAAAQQALAEAERRDVEAASEKARRGESLGSPPAAVAKAREKVERATRDASALQLASDGAADDLVQVMQARTEHWLAALNDEASRARERARRALAQLENALAEARSADSAALWLRSAADDGRFDRQLRPTVAGATAPSSAKLTANSEALTTAQLLDFTRELVDPPAPLHRPVLETPAPPAAA
jgi:hypothetical protein